MSNYKIVVSSEDREMGQQVDGVNSAVHAAFLSGISYGAQVALTNPVARRIGVEAALDEIVQLGYGENVVVTEL